MIGQECGMFWFILFSARRRSRRFPGRQDESPCVRMGVVGAAAGGMLDAGGVEKMRGRGAKREGGKRDEPTPPPSGAHTCIPPTLVTSPGWLQPAAPLRSKKSRPGGHVGLMFEGRHESVVVVTGVRIAEVCVG